MRAVLIILLCACGVAGPLVPAVAEEPLDEREPPVRVNDARMQLHFVADQEEAIRVEPRELLARVQLNFVAELAVPSSVDAGPPIPRTEDAGPRPVVVDAGVIDAGVIDAGVIDAGVIDAGVIIIVVADAGHGAQLSVHTTLGLPSAAQPGTLDDWLLVKPQYVAAYDTTHKVPRWVSWELSATWLGSAPRTSGFKKDPQLPASAPQAADSEYTNSGYDRGHICPSADRTATAADNAATFVLTNAVPQTHQSNAGPWETLEEEARTLVGTGKRLFIIAGPVLGATRQTIGNGVEVPLSTWKVVVVLDGPAAAVTSTTRVIAISVPNTMSVSGNWRGFRTTVDAIELSTGLDLLSDVEAATQAAVESRTDSQ